MSDEYAIHYVIQRTCRHRDDGGQSILKEQVSDGLRTQFGGFEGSGACHWASKRAAISTKQAAAG